jgi:dephospho-CoA kinase
MNSNCKVIGIIGEAGSGKTTYTNKMMETLDCLHIEGDKIGHEVLQIEEVMQSIIVHYGDAVISKNEVNGKNQINRQILGNIVFSNHIELEFLNKLTHPFIKEKIHQIITINKKLYDYILIDGAALIEAYVIELCDKIIYCYAPKEVRLHRLIEGRGIDKAKADSIIESQYSSSYYGSFADIIVDTTIEQSEVKMISYLRSLNEDIIE